MVLGKLYLPLSLRGDERNIGGHKKEREILGDAKEEKVVHHFQYDILWG